VIKHGTLILAGVLAVFMGTMLPGFALAEEPAVASEGTPKIEFSELAWDFGEVFPGDEATHEFKIFNKGDGLLKINNVRSSCGCTAAVTSKKEIGPGEEGSVKAAYNTHQGRGKVTKFITVFSNDPDQPEVKLRVSVTIMVDVEVIPNKAYFGHIFRDEDNKREIKVSSSTIDDFEVTEIETNNEHIATELVDAADDPKAKTLIVRIKDDAPLGRFQGNIVLHTNSKKQDKVTVPIIADIFGDIEIKPTRLYLSPHFLGEQRDGSITIRDRKEGGKLQIKSAEDKNGHLDVTVETLKEGVEYRITAKTKKDFPVDKPGHYAGMLVVKTNNASEPEIQVHYNGYIKPPQPEQ
jgi:hypothetical protein